LYSKYIALLYPKPTSDVKALKTSFTPSDKLPTKSIPINNLSTATNLFKFVFNLLLFCFKRFSFSSILSVINFKEFEIERISKIFSSLKSIPPLSFSSFIPIFLVLSASAFKGLRSFAKILAQRAVLITTANIPTTNIMVANIYFITTKSFLDIATPISPT